ALRRRVEQIINGRATWKAKAEEIERDRDRIAAELAAERRRTGQRRAATQQAEAAIERVRQMTDAWEQRLPDTIRTATAVEAIRTALPEPKEQSTP
ncbi:hypothetical protein, partial [Priestia megaterium]